MSIRLEPITIWGKPKRGSGFPTLRPDDASFAILDLTHFWAFESVSFEQSHCNEIDVIDSACYCVFFFPIWGKFEQFLFGFGCDASLPAFWKDDCRIISAKQCKDKSSPTFLWRSMIGGSFPFQNVSLQFKWTKSLAMNCEEQTEIALENTGTVSFSS